MRKLSFSTSVKRSKSVTIAQILLLIIAGMLSTIFVMTNNYGMRQTVFQSYSDLKDKMADSYVGLKEQVFRLSDRQSKTVMPDIVKEKCAFDEVDKARARPLMRAVVVYLSIAQLNTYLDQLKWCMRSLLEVMKSEPPLWRTDIIVFIDNVRISDLLDLGCSTIPRYSALEPFRCILVKYVRVQDRNLTSNSTAYERNLQVQMKDYAFIDSMYPLVENPSVYSSYDYVVRSDLDVFFTPAFAQWVPPHCAFITGHGGYSDDYNMERLAHVANYSGIHFNTTIWNIGSTWIGTPQLIAKVAERTVHWMVHLSKVEFSPKMRTNAWWSKADLWPEWHYGVLLLYGGHLAVNEVLQSGNAHPFQKLDLDHPTTSPANCSLDGPIHLHTYQTDDYFSKYAFNQRSYNATYPLPDVLNSTQCRDYAGYIAGDSLRMTNAELATRLLTAKDKFFHSLFN